MAFFTDTHSRTESFGARITSSASALLARVTESAARRRIARTTYAELSALSDRELADLGMHRSQIRNIAIVAARGAI